MTLAACDDDGLGEVSVGLLVKVMCTFVCFGKRYVLNNPPKGRDFGCLVFAHLVEDNSFGSTTVHGVHRGGPCRGGSRRDPPKQHNTRLV